ncbi:hypothetical protein ACJX0J_021582, partial [Zea mays]
FDGLKLFFGLANNELNHISNATEIVLLMHLKKISNLMDPIHNQSKTHIITQIVWTEMKRSLEEGYIEYIVQIKLAQKAQVGVGGFLAPVKGEDNLTVVAVVQLASMLLMRTKENCHDETKKKNLLPDDKQERRQGDNQEDISTDESSFYEHYYFDVLFMFRINDDRLHIHLLSRSKCLKDAHWYALINGTRKKHINNTRMLFTNAVIPFFFLISFACSFSLSMNVSGLFRTICSQLEQRTYKDSSKIAKKHQAWPLAVKMHIVQGICDDYYYFTCRGTCLLKRKGNQMKSAYR